MFARSCLEMPITENACRMAVFALADGPAKPALGEMMKTILTYIAAPLGLLLIIAGVFWWRTLTWTGELTSLRPHFDGVCETLEGMPGPEDMVIDHTSGQVFISSHDRRHKDSFGAIWTIATPGGAPQKMNLAGYTAALFSPHGIDLWTSKDGTRRLFVVEHGDWSQSRVVIFRIEGDTLVFETAVSDPLIRRPNDVAAVGKNAFYVTNSLAAPYGSSKEFTEVLFRKKGGNVVYFEGQKAAIAADGITYANGVARSNDGQTIYVGSSGDQAVLFYSRAPKTGALTLKNKIYLQTGVDNIDVDKDGVLWVAGHPKLLTFSKHAKDPAVRSPSQILRLDPVKKSIQEVYLSKGDPLSASSIGAFYDNTLYIGGVFDPRILRCTLPLAKRDKT